MSDSIFNKPIKPLVSPRSLEEVMGERIRGRVDTELTPLNRDGQNSDGSEYSPSEPSKLKGQAWPFPGSRKRPVGPPMASEGDSELRPMPPAEESVKNVVFKTVVLPFSPSASPLPSITTINPVLEKIDKRKEVDTGTEVETEQNPTPVSDNVVPPLTRMVKASPVAKEEVAPVEVTPNPPPLVKIEKAQPIVKAKEATQEPKAVDLIKIEKEIYAFVITGYDEIQLTNTVHAIFSPEIVKEMRGYTSSLKQALFNHGKILFERLSVGNLAERRNTGHLKYRVGVLEWPDSHPTILTMEVIDDDRIGEDGSSEDSSPYIAYTFTVQKYRMNSLTEDLRL